MPQPDFSPAADRNKQPILDGLRQVLPERGSALEIAGVDPGALTAPMRSIELLRFLPTDEVPFAIYLGAACAYCTVPTTRFSQKSLHAPIHAPGAERKMEKV